MTKKEDGKEEESCCSSGEGCGCGSGGGCGSGCGGGRSRCCSGRSALVLVLVVIAALAGYMAGKCQMGCSSKMMSCPMSGASAPVVK